jgi:hypothetical protein
MFFAGKSVAESSSAECAGGEALTRHHFHSYQGEEAFYSSSFSLSDPAANRTSLPVPYRYVLEPDITINSLIFIYYRER